MLSLHIPAAKGIVEHTPFFQMSFTTDALIGLVAVICPILLAFGVWGNVKGGQLPLSLPFSWHPVMMSVACTCLMPLGRWSYLSTTESLVGTKKASRRLIHRAIMCSAAVAMLLGYLAICLAHLPNQQFFGYDFKANEWKPACRIIHVVGGYTMIIAVAVQAVTGFLRMHSLQTKGITIFPVHSTMGDPLIAFGIINVCMGITLFGWQAGWKLIFILSALLSFAPTALWRQTKDGAQALLDVNFLKS